MRTLLPPVLHVLEEQTSAGVSSVKMHCPKDEQYQNTCFAADKM
jgi:hypothetical protein